MKGSGCLVAQASRLCGVEAGETPALRLLMTLTFFFFITENRKPKTVF
jgi:hypothetical protein